MVTGGRPSHAIVEPTTTVSMRCWFAEDRICTWCGGVCRELVRPRQEYTKVALFSLTGLLPPDAEQWRVLRCEECGHLEWFLVGQ